MIYENIVTKNKKEFKTNSSDLVTTTTKCIQQISVYVCMYVVAVNLLTKHPFIRQPASQ